MEALRVFAIALSRHPLRHCSKMETFGLDGRAAQILPRRRNRRGPMRWAMSELLIVDDEPEFLDELMEAFAFNGVVARAAGSATAALALLDSDRDIRVVISDIRMPDMDGLVMIETAKTRYPGRDLTFVVMTGHAATADLDRARAAGVRHCFPKPLSFEDLQGAIQEALAES